MQAVGREIAIWDRGELQDVRELLQGFGVDVSGDADKDARQLPTHLLISSGSDSPAAIRQIRQARPSHHFLHLVIVEGPSRSLVATLEREGCDMVVPAPIHPTALRLIVQRALFSGQDRRTLPRVAIAAKVKLKKGLWAHTATLAELSTRGCGVITREALEVRDKVGLVFPSALSGGSALRVEGDVVGVNSTGQLESGRCSAAIVFRGATKAQAAAIKGIMLRNAVGPTGPLAMQPGTPVGGSIDIAANSSEGCERRTGSRHRYEQSLLARGDGKIHSLVCRDLSIGGMRVAQDTDLEIGSQLRLAIYGTRGADPVVVSAGVVRRDSDIGLEFGPLDPGAVARLQAIVDSLPKIDGSHAPGTVVSEVLTAD